MSHIKRLKIKGFKSFANETTLNFENNFNTIVGANGSGKSNIFDALCFVLGRISSKELRTQKLGNLVFNGGAGLKPMGKAEVSIYLSNEKREIVNEDIDELKISRVVTKKGSSDYFINNNKSTRTNIIELLSKIHINPDGYNIILQGDISKVVNMTPIERRELIEEISNIKEYEDKRKKGVLKLDKINIDLEQADILINEKSRYIKDLKSEKENAQKFNEVKKNLETNTLLFLDKKILKNSDLKDKKKEELSKNEKSIKEQDTKFLEVEKKLEDISSEINSIEKKIEINSRDDYISVSKLITQNESEISQKETKISENNKQKKELDLRENELNLNIKSNDSEIEKLQKENLNLTKQKEKNEKEFEKIVLDIKNIKNSEAKLDFSKLDKIENEISELIEKKENKFLIKQDNSIQIEKLNNKIENLEQVINKNSSSNSENKENLTSLENFRNENKKLVLEISKNLNEENLISQKINNFSNEVSSLEDELLKLEVRDKTKREVLFQNKSVSKIIEISKSNKEIIGTLMDLISCDKKYQNAIETICKRNLFSIIVENDKTAVECVNFLKENKIGSAFFFPLNKINFKINLDKSIIEKKGVIGYAKELIKYDSRYENIINLVFQDTLIIENIEDSKSIGINRFKMVSLDGDVVNKSGVISGGFISKNQRLGVLKTDNSSNELQKIQEKISQKQNVLDVLKGDKKNFEKVIYDKRVRKMEVEAEILKLEKLLEIEGVDIDSIKKELENLLRDKSLITSTLEKIDKSIVELDREISKNKEIKNNLKQNFNSDNLVQNLNKLEDMENEKREVINNLKRNIEQNEIKIESVLKLENSKIKKLAEDISKQKKSIEDLNKELDNEIKQIKKELEVSKKKEKELSKDFESFSEKKNELKEKQKKLLDKQQNEFEKLTKLKEKSSNINFQIDEFNKLNEVIQKDKDDFLFEIKTKIEQNLYSQEDYNNLIEENSKLLKKEIDLKELQNKVNNLKIKLNSFGSINLKAVEVYDKLKDEFDTLMEKRQSLTEEKKGIINFIEEIDKVKKVRFLETFENIKKHFVEIFSQISKKGKVELTIQNEKDLFNSGIDIRVRLSKTNYLDIKSLSGGEKTITAISFIFAIQEFNPASFYILDEVDAALDIMNCEMLGKLILKYSKKAQYICVSHSEHFIQSSDIIYGVAMNSSKISDALSLDLRSVSEYTEKEV